MDLRLWFCCMFGYQCFMEIEYIDVYGFCLDSERDTIACA